MKTTLLVVISLSGSLINVPAEEVLPVFPGLEVVVPAEERLSLVIHQGQMVYVTNGVERSLIDFTFDEHGATYRFKTLDRLSKAITSGNGRVFEKYRKTPRRGGGFDVVDDGGELMIKAGVLKLEWSFKSGKDGFIYFDPRLLHVYILNAKYFDLARFK